MRRVDHYFSTIWTEARMRIAAKLIGILRRRIEMAQWVSLSGSRLVKIGILVPFAIRIGVVQNPARTRQVTAMPVHDHDVPADYFHFVRQVGIKVELIPMRRVRCPGQDVPRVAPDEMGGLAVRVHNIEIGSVRIRGEHTGTKAGTPWLGPAMPE